VAAEPSMDL